MTAHDHRTLVPGCYRCELDKYEVMNALAKARWVVAEDCFDVGRHVVADLPAMQPGDSVRVTMTDDGFDVVPLRLSAAAREAWGAEMWVDAPEQENDR